MFEFEHVDKDTKDSELDLGRKKSGDTLMEACSGTDVQTVCFNLSESAKERVATYLPNGLVLNMDGAQTGDQDPAAAQHVFQR